MNTVRIQFGGIFLKVTTEVSAGSLYERITSVQWLAHNANTIAQSIAPSSEIFLFGANWLAFSQITRVRFVENNINNGGLHVYFKFVGNTMDPIVGAIGTMVFSLSPRASLPEHQIIFSDTVLQADAPAIAAFVVARYGAWDNWYGTDVSNMSDAQKTQFLVQEITAKRLNVFIPDP